MSTLRRVPVLIRNYEAKLESLSRQKRASLIVFAVSDEESEFNERRDAPLSTSTKAFVVWRSTKKSTKKIIFWWTLIGAATFSVATHKRTTLSIVIKYVLYERHIDECHFVKCHYVNCYDNCCYVECRYAEFRLVLCFNLFMSVLWMSLSRVSLCWVSLSRWSWHPLINYNLLY